MSSNNAAPSSSSSLPGCGKRELYTFIALAILTLVSFVTFQGDPTSPPPTQQHSSSSSSFRGSDAQQQQQQQQRKTARGDTSSSSSSTSFSPASDNSINDLSSSSATFSSPAASSSTSARSGIMRTSTNPRRPFRFHIYKLPRQYVEGAIEHLEAHWATSICNRGNKKSDYTMLDWRHAHSLFTADVYITRYMRLHPQHTEDPNEADAFIVPMMSHLYNCAGLMHYMIDILTLVYQRHSKHYKEMDHRDHYLFWWRWGMHYGSVQKFWRRVTRYFPNINLISFDLLEIMGRNAYQDFSLALKPRFDRNLLNIIMPYPDFSPLLLTPAASSAEEAEDDDDQHGGKESSSRHTRQRRQRRRRKFLFYFAGTSTIGGIRRWIKWNCEPSLLAARNYEPSDCVYVDFASSVTDTKRLGVPTDYPHAMMDSVFCGHAAGDALSSRRPTSAVLAGCIPVLICDLCLYAWEGFIDYTAFAVFIPEADVIAGRLVPILKKIAANETHLRMLRTNLRKVRPHFVYHNSTPQPGDALDMLAKELERRGTLTRQYRRWFQVNAHLSSDAKDYPVDPPPVMKYVKRSKDGTTFDRHDAEKLKNFKPL